MEIGGNVILQEVQTSEYFYSIDIEQQRITSTTRPKKYLLHCDNSYAEVMFNLGKQLHKILDVFRTVITAMFFPLTIVTCKG